LVREDAGLHIGAALFLLCGALYILRKRQLARDYLVISAACLGYSALILALQQIYYPLPVGALRHVYFGNPIWAHLSWLVTWDRLGYILKVKAYDTLPYLLVVGAAILRRAPILAVGPVAVLPWLVMSLFAATPGPATLAGYYAFPLIIALAWPAVAFAHGCKTLRLQWAVSVLSTGLFVASGSWSHWDIRTPDVQAVGRYERALREAIQQQRAVGTIMVSDSVASLVPEALKPDEWANQWAIVHLPSPNAVIYRPDAYDALSTLAVIDASETKHTERIGDTPFFVVRQKSKPPAESLTGKQWR
jgi:hypothetical protein